MREIIKDVVALYKADFTRIDSAERYKWIAVKHFQDNWNIDATDFADIRTVICQTCQSACRVYVPPTCYVIRVRKATRRRCQSTVQNALQ